MPVDVVYTWVDPRRSGFATDLEAAKRGYLLRFGCEPHPRSLSLNRFEGQDDLRFSMRALFKHAPWFRHLYIVTAGEVPAWLSRDHRRIKLVSHDMIFRNPHALPSFNSHAIELCIGEIPDLSDNFVYLNDDVLFLRPTSLDYFIAAGFPRIRFGRGYLPNEQHHTTPVGASGAFCRELLDRYFGYRDLRFEAPHEAVLYNRRILAEIAAIWPDQIAATRQATLRSPRDFGIHRIYPHFLMEMMARNRDGREADRIAFSDAGFVALGRKPALIEFQLAKIAKRMPNVLCINDESGEHEDVTEAEILESRRLLSTWLEERLPEPAPWENDG
jgi:hypothetical protein